MTDPPLPDERLNVVLGRLEKIKRGAGGWYSARCPAHEDSSPSLGVVAGRSAIVINCRAGCSVDAVRAALRLEWKDLFYDDETWRRDEPEKKPPFDRRGYELESQMMAERLQREDAVLARARAERGWIRPALRHLGVGWDGERFTIPTREKDGRLNDVLRYQPFGSPKRKMLATAGRSRQPFPAPEQVSTVQQSRCLYVVEGEGTAISLASCWMPVVALPGAIARQSGDLRRPGKFEGVGWHQTWAKRFAHHPRIVLLPDSDEIGRLLMQTVLYDLSAQTDSDVSLCDPGLPEGEDVGDLIGLCGTREQRRLTRRLLEMLWHCPPEQREEGQQVLGGWRGWLANPGSAEPEPVTAGWSWA